MVGTEGRFKSDQALLLRSLQGGKDIKQIIKTEFNAIKKKFIPLLHLTHISQGPKNLRILLEGPHRSSPHSHPSLAWPMNVNG